MNKDRVVGAVNRGERVTERNHRGVHARADSLGAVRADDALGDGQQLDDISRLARFLNLFQGDPGNSLAIHRFDRHVRVERERGEDGCLLGGIESLDVSGRVGFGVSQFGRHREGGLHRFTVGVDAVENEVRRTVDDSENAVDTVTGQRLAQRANNRNGSSDGGFVKDLRADLSCRVKDFGAVMREQCLVRGNDVGACVDGRQNQRAGRFDTAHYLDDDVGVPHKRLGVGRDEVSGNRRLASGLRVAHGNTDQFQPGTNASGELIAVLQNLVGDL